MSVLSLDQLRQKHPLFRYQKVEFAYRDSALTAEFHYSFGEDLPLVTKLAFPDISVERWQKIDQKVVANWLFQIGMVEALSYWKAACSPQFVIEAGWLSEEQLLFWQELLQKGLSEFFFVNKIDGWDPEFVKFQVAAVKPEKGLETSVDHQTHAEQIILPIGGGKDSAVGGEVLKKLNLPMATLTINVDPVELIKASKISPQLKVQRQLDPKLRELNAQGYLNGHTPFNAMAAFVITLAAYLYDYTYVAVSNEWSANEGNTVFLGQPINHQYSKSLEFEGHFRNYCHRYLSTTVEYLSVLRPLHEIQIARLFSQYPQYWHSFLSCNRGQKSGKWCGECPKCLFVYIMLSPFLTQQELISIFGQNLLMKMSLQPIFDQLTGVAEVKSLECVGTRQETLVALHLTLERWSKMQPAEPVPALLLYAEEEILTKVNDVVHQMHQILNHVQHSQYLPKSWMELITAENDAAGNL